MKCESRPVDQQLQEREKELSCLYAVSQIIVEEGLARPDRMRRIVATLPPALRHPDRGVARLTLDGERFGSSEYEEARTVIGADLVVDGVRRGAVEVGYTSASGADEEAPFLEEERSLLQNVARQVSLFITRQEGAARRTALEEQLRHADRLATIGQLAAGVAHEMNEPLSSILGCAQLAMKAPDVPQSVLDDLREIVTASLRAREIVKKLLLFARQTPPKTLPINLNEIVEDAPPQVVRHDHRVEGPFAEGPALRALQIGFNFPEPRMLEPRQPRQIPIEREDGALRREKPMRVPAGTRGEVEHLAARADQMREPHHPARGGERGG